VSSVAEQEKESQENKLNNFSQMSPPAEVIRFHRWTSESLLGFSL
jgi:hypothetical protein